MRSVVARRAALAAAAVRAAPRWSRLAGGLARPTQYRSDGCGLTADDADKQVTLAGWVQAKRVWASSAEAQGRPAFLVLRDDCGEVQLVVDPGARAALEAAASVSLESCVRARGVVRARPDGQARGASGGSGAVEVVVSSLEILNGTPQGAQPPYPVAAAVAEDKGGAGAAGTGPGEDVRLRHRPLDLRRPRMQRNLRARAAVTHALRRCLAEDHDLVEVETPSLFLSTPEGAREFVVPSRDRGRFYALVQSPQQHKQMLAAAGVTRYFQVARCYRDEGGRSDRQPEFTQLDVELGLAGAEDVMAVAEAAVDAALGASNDAAARLAHLAPPLRRVRRRAGASGGALPRFRYADCVSTLGSDRPLRRLGVAPAGEGEGVAGGAELPLLDVSAVVAAPGAVLRGEGGAAGEALAAAASRASASLVPDGSALGPAGCFSGERPGPSAAGARPPPASLASLRPSRTSVRAVRLPRLGSVLSRKALEAAVRDLRHAAGAAGRACSAAGLGIEAARVREDGAWAGSALGKCLSQEARSAVGEALRAEPGDVILVAAGPGDSPCRALGACRTEGAAAVLRAEAAAGRAGKGRPGGGRRAARGRETEATAEGGAGAGRAAEAEATAEGGAERVLDLFWVTGFPLFETVAPDDADPGAGAADGSGGPVLAPAHHPFTAPVPEHMGVLKRAMDEGWDPRSDEAARDALACVEAQAYDVVCDGSELGGGSVRMHRPEDQEAVFAALHLPDERIATFRHLLDALRWGAPPHAGIAFGLDRMVAILTEASSIRDVIAFPKTTGGQDLLSGAPGPVDEATLREYNVAVREP